ncbi:MAG: GDSL-type esterase/lipase family protein [Oscillospiraceae bacterium]
MKSGSLEPGIAVDSASSLLSSSESEPDSDSDSLSAPDSQSVTDSTTSATASQPDVTTPAVNPVLQCESVGMEYFSDCIFIGDSLSVGLSGYGFLPYENVYASVGLNISKIDTEPVSTPYGDVTVMEGLKNSRPPIVYIMLGSNGISWMSNATMLEKYGSFVDQIRAELPDTKIYVIAIPPVSVDKETTTEYPVQNTDIDAYNSELLSFANEKSLYFVDLNTTLKNNEGKLDPEKAQKDGMHFKLDTYQIMLDYLMTHVAQ